MRHILTALVLSALPLAGHAQAPGDEAAWDVVYTADALPTESGWGASQGENTSAEIADGALHIIDAGTARTQLHCYSRHWGARPERGAIVRATVKLVDCTDRSGMCLLVADGVHEAGLTFYPDRIVLSNLDLEHAMDTTDGFHTYEIRIAGINIEVWVDGAPVIDGWGKFIHEAYEGRRIISFGSISSAATAEAYWRDVRYVAHTIPAEPIAGAQNVVIYRQEGIYACFPSLMRLDDGRLVTGFATRARRSHIDNTGGGARAISRDGGYTWELTEERFTDPRTIRDDGTRIVPHAGGWTYVPEEQLPEVRARGRRWMKAREGTIAYLTDPRVRIEPPDGEARIIELQSPLPGGSMGHQSASSFLHAGDLWLNAIYCSPGQEGLSSVWVIRSGDNGESWALHEVAHPIGDRIGFSETALCDNGRGEIIAVMRSGSGGEYNTYQSFSSDGGLTWSPPEDTGIWGYPCNVILLDDGRLLCTYGYRRDAMGIRAVLSEDGGHTWKLSEEIVLRADGWGNGGDNGYPLSMQMDDGHIFTIYYLNDRENVTHIAGTHWSVPPAE